MHPEVVCLTAALAAVSISVSRLLQVYAYLRLVRRIINAHGVDAVPLIQAVAAPRGDLYSAGKSGPSALPD